MHTCLRVMHNERLLKRRMIAAERQFRGDPPDAARALPRR